MCSVRQKANSTDRCHEDLNCSILIVGDAIQKSWSLSCIAKLNAPLEIQSFVVDLDLSDCVFFCAQHPHIATLVEINTGYNRQNTMSSSRLSRAIS